MNIKRREFLKRSALGVGGLITGAELARASESAGARFDPYESVPLGKTKLKFSRFCLGTGVHGGNRQSNATRMGKEKFEALIQGAYERGVRVFDLADLYGTHPFLIPALKSIPRRDYQVITKIWFRSGGIPEKERPDADVVVERFLKEIQTDYLDLVLLHCVESGNWPQELQKQMELLAKLKQKGVIRAHGVSCHSLAALEAASSEPWVDSVHARINPYGMSMDDKPEKVVPVLKKLHANGKGVVGMKIIGEGRLRNDDEKRNESARFVLGLGCVDVLNIGFEKVEEIDDFASRVRKVSRPV
ncbi:MAG TPA: aldo/keto reductase [Candidatus Limnocylindrales bacterium]|jgi:aryl-alcohol dehydrogenase-like predicted oxidoreductase|nr:aldo/keto reductase [Candidatus Limnocylindrales bacterium]